MWSDEFLLLYYNTLTCDLLKSCNASLIRLLCIIYVRVVNAIITTLFPASYSISTSGSHPNFRIFHTFSPMQQSAYPTRKNNNKKSRNGHRRPTNSSAFSPPQFESNVKSHHRFRFVASAAESSFAITDTAVLGAMGSMGTATNSAVTVLFRSFKIKRLEMWSAPPSQGSSATCSVEWFGFGNSPSVEHSDTTLSVAKNAHISVKPPSQSLASFWQKSTSTNLFVLNFTAGTIIDIIVDLILNDDEAAAQTVAVTTAVVGTIYYLALDQALGSHILVPVSLTTTF
jgi:hypothetical protein